MGKESVDVCDCKEIEWLEVRVNEKDQYRLGPLACMFCDAVVWSTMLTLLDALGSRFGGPVDKWYMGVAGCIVMATHLTTIWVLVLRQTVNLVFSIGLLFSKSATI